MAGAPNIFHNGLTARLLTRSLHNGTSPPPPHAIRGVEGAYQRNNLLESNNTTLLLLWRLEL